MREREIVSFNGAPGSGKSTKMRERMAKHGRAVVIDPSPDKDDGWRRAGYARCCDLPELSAAMASRFRGTWRFVWTPPADACGEALHELSRLLFAYQEREPLRKPIALGVDEMAECNSIAQERTSSLSGFRRLLLQGRHVEVSIYGATQRPQDVGTRFRDNAGQSYFFELYGDAARDAVLAKIGREYRAQYLSLQRFEYLFFDRGRVVKGCTRKGA